MKTDVPKTTTDLTIIVFISFFSFLIFSKFDVLEKIVELSARYEDYEIDEILSTLIVISFCLIWFSFRRWRESKIINKELLEALTEIKKLEGIIPICMHCKKIRDDEGSWNKLEKYICDHSEAEFSHSICNNCLKEHYPEIADEKDPM